MIYATNLKELCNLNCGFWIAIDYVDWVLRRLELALIDGFGSSIGEELDSISTTPKKLTSTRWFIWQFMNELPY